MAEREKKRERRRRPLSARVQLNAFGGSSVNLYQYSTTAVENGYNGIRNGVRGLSEFQSTPPFLSPYTYSSSYALFIRSVS